MNGNSQNLSTSTLHVKIEDGIAWVTLDRPEKRNAMNPAMNSEMLELLDIFETDDRCHLLVLSGAGETFSAGMDIKEYFRDTDDLPLLARHRIFRDAGDWQWRRLRTFPKPTIAMVNGHCFGGAFTPVIACDIAVAAEEAQFGLSEINWGIIPAGNVAKALQTVMSDRLALYHILTGETFDGRKAAEFGVVTEAVPHAVLRGRVREIAGKLMEKNPTVLWQAKTAWRNLAAMDWEVADDYLRAKQEQGQFRDAEKARTQGMSGFIDSKSFRPGFGSGPAGKPK